MSGSCYKLQPNDYTSPTQQTEKKVLVSLASYEGYVNSPNFHKNKEIPTINMLLNKFWS